MPFLFSLILLFSSHSAWSSVDGREYKITSPGQKLMERVASEYEVLRKLDDGYAVFVSTPKLASFKVLVPMAQLIEEAKLKSFELSNYRNYESVSAELQSLVLKYPDLVKLEVYGTTKSGHTLYALKVSDNVKVDEDEPELMITSATHGDELISVEVTMELLNELLSSYGKDQRLTRMIADHEVYFLPMVNAQGYAGRSRYSGWTDPNRDYPYPEQENRQSVDCIDSLIKFFHAHDFKGSLDIHASGEMVMYPWAYTREAPAADDERNFDYLVKSMAELNGYKAGQISKVIYVAKGSSADYYYWKNKTVAIAVELTTTKVPSYSKVPEVVAEAREMIWRFIENF